MVKAVRKGSFANTKKYFKALQEPVKIEELEKYAEEGVVALRNATPRESGETASSWSYEIVKENHRVTIYWKNSNFNGDVSIAVILQYGHATKNGSWVEGTDYINPALAPIFDKIADNAWEEVKGL